MKLFEPNISKLRKKRKVKQLIKLLDHPRDSRIREKAAEALGWIGDASAVYPLIPILKDEHFTVRIAAAEALGRIGDASAVNPLISIMKDEYFTVRMAAAEALGRIGDASAVNPLNSILKDEHPSVRKAAAEALVNIWKPSIESLIIALKYDDLFVREAAAEALESIGWKPTQDEAGARFWIAKKEWERCVEIGEPAVNPLISILKDENPSVRRAAAEALVKIGKPSIRSLVVALKHDDLPVRESAVKVLEGLEWKPKQDEAGARFWIAKQKWDRCVEIGEPAVNPLISILKDEHSSVRKAAAEALGMIGDARAVDPLFAALEDNTWPVIEAAAEALGRIGDARAFEPLCALLVGRCEEVVKAAAKALLKFKQHPNFDAESKKRLLVVEKALAAAHYDEWVDICGHLEHFNKYKNLDFTL